MIFKLKGLFALTVLITGVLSTGVAIAQDDQEEVGNQGKVEQTTCEAKKSGMKKEEYLSEYPTQEEVDKATGENKSNLQALLEDKQRTSKEWDNCGK
jgi:hypothetical protein